jgi:hypothetical protein
VSESTIFCYAGDGGSGSDPKQTLFFISPQARLSLKYSRHMHKALVPVLFFALSLSAKASDPLSERTALLPPSQALRVLQQCSRETPRKVGGTWCVGPAVIARLEQDLPQLSKLVSKACCGNGLSVPDPSSYYRQYAGITIDGHDYIYINAFHDRPISFRPQDQDRWRTEPERVCDGGSSFWGALYDPETRQFSQLSFNGSA